MGREARNGPEGQKPAQTRCQALGMAVPTSSYLGTPGTSSAGTWGQGPPISITKEPRQEQKPFGGLATQAGCIRQMMLFPREEQPEQDPSECKQKQDSR